jgi:hypothetical protein
MVFSSFDLTDLTCQSWYNHLNIFSISDLTPNSWDCLLTVFQQCILPPQNQDKKIIFRNLNALPGSYRNKIFAQICLESGDSKVFNRLKNGGINYLGDLREISWAIRNVVCLTFDQLDNNQRDYIKSAWRSYIEKGDFHNRTLSDAHTGVLISSLRELCSINMAREIQDRQFRQSLRSPT